MIAFLGLGSNIGDKLSNLQFAISKLKQLDIDLIDSSPIYETKPMYNLNQVNFYNQVIKISTNIKPDELLKCLKKIEFELGRDLNAVRNSERIIDIDILSVENLIYENNSLKIPHPLLHERTFVLKPWNDIAPEYLVSKYNLSVNQLYENLEEKDNIKLIYELEVIN